MPDQQIICATCRRRFTWTTGEQQFFRERGLQRPKRCPACREARGSRTAEPPGRPRPSPPRLPVRRLSPYQIFGGLTLVATVVLTVALLLYIPSAPLFAWLLGVNAVAFLTYGYDKMVAGRLLRVPELVLLGLALAGGALGALLGMLLFQHKTGRESGAFRARFWWIVALQVALLIAWLTLRTIR